MEAAGAAAAHPGTTDCSEARTQLAGPRHGFSGSGTAVVAGRRDPPLIVVDYIYIHIGSQDLAGRCEAPFPTEHFELLHGYAFIFIYHRTTTLDDARNTVVVDYIYIHIAQHMPNTSHKTALQQHKHVKRHYTHVAKHRPNTSYKTALQHYTNDFFILVHQTTTLFSHETQTTKWDVHGRPPLLHRESLQGRGHGRHPEARRLYREQQLQGT
jgi:hypothetical protein